MTSAIRAAIYARHSTDKQNPSSSEDQAAACMPLVTSLGAVVVGTFADPEVSGYRRDRRGLRHLLAEAGAGQIDVIVAESLDRIARDPEDVAWLGKKLQFERVRLHTKVEGEVDHVKFAVAAMLGSMFLANLQHKTRRGLEAVVLAGRLAGGRAYGYRKAIRLDGRGQPVAGVLEIEEAEAEIIRAIYRDFSGGLSALAIAKRLNAEAVPGPRGGQWNASTIRGDPRKQVGILNNPLYVGRLVWNRREWRKNPDSDERERRYRLRDESEWISVDVPELRIVEDAAAACVRDELARRALPTGSRPEARKRKRHLLSGLIKCGACGSNFVISGKDYYRCAGAKERGTCLNKVAVRAGPLEDVVLNALQEKLLTEEHAKLFVTEFQREITRLQRAALDTDSQAAARLIVLDKEIENLASNMLAGVVSPTIATMLDERETEREQLKRKIGDGGGSVAEIIPHPALLRRFTEKVQALRSSLQADGVRTEAAETLSQLIDEIVIRPDGEEGPVAHIGASAVRLLQFANEKKPRRFRDKASSSSITWLRGQDLNL